MFWFCISRVKLWEKEVRISILSEGDASSLPVLVRKTTFSYTMKFWSPLNNLTPPTTKTWPLTLKQCVPTLRGRPAPPLILIELWETLPLFRRSVIARWVWTSSLRISDVFRGYRNGRLGYNGLLSMVERKLKSLQNFGFMLGWNITDFIWTKLIEKIFFLSFYWL